MDRARDHLAGISQLVEGGLEQADSAIALLTGPEQPGTTWDDVRGWVIRPPSVPTGTLEALIQTGDINLLRNPDLRGTVIRELEMLRDSPEVLFLYLDLSIRAEEAWNLAREMVRGHS